MAVTHGEGVLGSVLEMTPSFLPFQSSPSLILVNLKKRYAFSTIGTLQRTHVCPDVAILLLHRAELSYILVTLKTIL